MRIITIILSFYIFLSVQLNAQVLTANFSTKDATCSSNGQITVNVSGGTPGYTYNVIGCTNCLIVGSPLTTFTWSTFAPGTYTVEVSDQASPTPARVTQQVTVGGTYQTPSFTVIQSLCRVSLTGSLGLPPYRFQYSTNGGTTWTALQNENFYDKLPPRTYTFRIQDACDNITQRDFTVTYPALSIQGVSCGVYGTTTFGITVNMNAPGVQPLRYVAFNGNDTVRSSTNQLNLTYKCAPWAVFVEDDCGQRTAPTIVNCSNYSLAIECMNCVDGTATLVVSGGTKPFVYKYENASGVLVNNPAGPNNPNFSGLPRGVAGYTFSVQDSCGKVVGVQAKCMTFDGNSTCGRDSMRFRLQNGVVAKQPITIACTTCPDKTPSRFSSQKSYFGKPRVCYRWVDSCGQVFSGCVLPGIAAQATSLCNSISVIATRTIADSATGQPRGNVIISRVPLSLYRLNNTLVESNDVMEFKNLLPGKYKLVGTDPDCPIDTFFVELATGFFEMRAAITSVRRPNANSTCKNAYRLNVQGPPSQPVIRGTLPPDWAGSTWNGNVSTTGYQGFIFLPPGTYTIGTLDGCARDTTIVLPPITRDPLTFIPPKCPADGTIRLSGAKTPSFWNAWGSTRTNIPIVNTNSDIYTINCIWTPTSCTGSSNGTIPNQVYGNTYTAYLYPSWESQLDFCPVDTLTFKLEATGYKPPDSLKVIYARCLNSNRGTIIGSYSGTGGPFRLEVTETRGGPILASATGSGNSIDLNYDRLGTFFFRLVDSCGTSTDGDQTIPAPSVFDASLGNVDCNASSFKIQSTILEGATYTYRNTANNQVVGSGVNLWSFTPPNSTTSVTYRVTIEVGNCQVLNKTVVVPSLNQLAVTTQLQKRPNCSQAIVANVTGGNPPVTYRWIPGNSTGSEVLNPAAGLYTVSVTDANGCSAVATIDVVAIPKPIVNITPRDGKVKPGENITLNANVTPVAGTYTYEWKPDSFVVSGANSSSLTVMPTRNVTYKVTVTDTDGCVGTDTVVVRFTLPLKVGVPNNFTPTGDGINDVFQPFVENGRVTNMKIWARWGEKVYDGPGPWDGKLDGKDLPIDSYYYVIDALSDFDEIQQFKGNVTLVR
jgi:gliding motility-associated-like protein